MTSIDDQQDDVACDALAESLRNVCADYPDHIVLFELVARLGETIGRFSIRERPTLVVVAEVELRQYVSEIPPLPTDAYPGSLD